MTQISGYELANCRTCATTTSKWPSSTTIVRINCWNFSIFTSKWKKKEKDLRTWGLLCGYTNCINVKRTYLSNFSTCCLILARELTPGWTSVLKSLITTFRRAEQSLFAKRHVKMISSFPVRGIPYLKFYAPFLQTHLEDLFIYCSFCINNVLVDRGWSFCPPNFSRWQVFVKNNWKPIFWESRRSLFTLFCYNVLCMASH